MKSKYKILYMSFDGEYKLGSPIFNTIFDARDYSNDLGSKWYLYPFHFVVTESGKTIRDTPQQIEKFNNRKVKTVSKIFANLHRIMEDNQINAGCDEFIYYLTD